MLKYAIRDTLAAIISRWVFFINDRFQVAAVLTKTILIDLNSQQLQLCGEGGVLASYPISTSAKGAGEVMGSEQTPRGEHYIRAKIGEGLPKNAVLVGRRFTNEIYTRQFGAQHPKRDWILTRILWLSGKEPGKNRLGEVDSMRRYIYLHGTPDSEPLGVPASHGCIRMSNDDIIELFSLVSVGCPVTINS